ncbi:MAG: T9SS type A sorting domain-containing protein [Bacteroidota bacterium]
MKTITTTLLLALTVLVFQAQGQMTNFGNITIHPSSNLSITGDFVNNGTLDDQGKEIVFNGTLGQTISGTSVTTFRNVIINNNNGVTLQKNMIVSDSLVLTLGPLMLNSKSITLQRSAPSAITRSTGYIISEQTNLSSKIIWNIGTSSGNFIFPLGTIVGNYIPFTLVRTSGDMGNVTVASYPTGVNNTPYPISPTIVSNLWDVNETDNSANVVDRFWEIDKDGPDGVGTLTFTATAAEVGIIVDLQAQRWNSVASAWEAPLAGQTNTVFAATVPGVGSFSSWALSGSTNPLPISLFDFQASKNNEQVDVKWTTLTETNSDYFTIEKTKDGNNFETVGIVKATGNSNSLLNYSLTDFNPYSGMSYYRLRETDFDGTEFTSNLVTVNFESSSSIIANVYPNPTNTEGFKLELEKANGKNITVTITEMTGKIIYNKQIITDSEFYSFNPLEDLVLYTGMYLLSVSCDGFIYNEKIMLKH